MVQNGEETKNGGKDRDRTGDTRIFSPLLYQLSYPATEGIIRQKMVARTGIEPVTHGFSVRCSTN